MRLFSLKEDVGGEESGGGFVTDIEKATTKNTDYRRVLFTTDNTQLVVMCIKPGDEIGEEVHKKSSQFVRVEAGKGKVSIDGEEFQVKDGGSAVIPSGKKHNVVNTSNSEDLKLYVLYSPPVHSPDAVQTEKKDKK